MSPLRLESDAECGRCWKTGDGITHVCTMTPGHVTGHHCYCGVCSDQTPAASPSFTEAAGALPASPPSG